MREIKFRAWEKNLKEIIQVYNIDFENRLINKDGVWRMFNEIELMQYTGLKDKNGREIYEGDIVRTWEETEHIPMRDDGGGIVDYDQMEGFSQLGVVEFKGAWFTYETKKHLKGRQENIYAPLDFTNDLEVIGNIYENPKPLEGASL